MVSDQTDLQTLERALFSLIISYHKTIQTVDRDMIRLSRLCKNSVEGSRSPPPPPPCMTLVGLVRAGLGHEPHPSLVILQNRLQPKMIPVIYFVYLNSSHLAFMFKTC